MSVVEEIRDAMRVHAGALLHPIGPEAQADALNSVLDVIHTPEGYYCAVSWLAAAAADALQRIRATLPEAARDAMFAPMTMNPLTGEPLTPSQTATMRIITACANEDFDMVQALIMPYAYMQGPTAHDAGHLLAEIAKMAHHFHGQVCGGGH